MKKELRVAGKQEVDAIVLSAERTRKGDRVRLGVQIMGGGTENLYPLLEQFEALKPQIGQTIAVEVVYQPWGKAETTTEKDGKSFKDSFTTFRQRVFLPRIPD